jgi:hypothetical protein
MRRSRQPWRVPAIRKRFGKPERVPDKSNVIREIGRVPGNGGTFWTRAGRVADSASAQPDNIGTRSGRSPARVGQGQEAFRENAEAFRENAEASRGSAEASLTAFSVPATGPAAGRSRGREPGAHRPAGPESPGGGSGFGRTPGVRRRARFCGSPGRCGPGMPRRPARHGTLPPASGTRGDPASGMRRGPAGPPGASAPNFAFPGAPGMGPRLRLTVTV